MGSHAKKFALCFFAAILISLPIDPLKAQEKAQGVDEKSVEKVTLEIMVQSLPGKSPDMKRRIIRNITIHGDKKGVGPMVFVMLDPREEFETRREAAKAAMALGGEKEFAAILKLLKGKESFECHELISVLVEISDKRFVEPLLQYMSLAQAHESCREPATRAYLKMMKDDYSFDFSVLKDTEGERVLVRVADKWSNYYKKRAVYILGELNSLRSHHVLLKRLADRDHGVKLEAVRALSKIKDCKSAHPLGQVLKNDPSVEMKEEVIKTLVSLECSQTTKEIDEYFKKSSPKHKVFIFKTINSVNTGYAGRLSGMLLRNEKDTQIVKMLQNEK